MAKLLAIDLAWSGPSGYVLWDSELDDPIIKYGEIRARAPKEKGIYRDQIIAIDLYRQLFLLLSRNSADFGWLIHEYTDWHRSLKGNAKREYAIERRAQRTLGMAVATLTIAASNTLLLNLERIVPLGANEARREFGAQRKDAACRLIAEEYPRFEFGEHKTGFLRDTLSNQLVSDHISDAIVLASVGSKRIRLAEMAK